MKKIATLVIMVGSYFVAMSQDGVSISTSNQTPDPSAMLDVVSSNKGMLIPRMTTTQRNAIASPATGLQIYNTITNTFQYYDGSVWREFGISSGDGDWTISGNDMYAIPSGNVGVGLTTPFSKFHVRNGATSFSWTPISGTVGIFEGASVDRAFVTITGLSTGQSELWFADESLQNAGRVRYDHTNDDLEFWANGIEQMKIMSNGNVGVGTPSPLGKFHVNSSTSDAIRITRSGANTFGFQIGGSIFGLYDFTNSQYKWRTEGGDVLLVETSGNVGIGTTNPGLGLEIASDRSLRIRQDATYYTDLSSNTGNFIIQSLGQYIDLRPNNSTHGLILRDHTGGSTIWSAFRTINSTKNYLHITQNSVNTSEGICIDDDGEVGLGIADPQCKLHIFESNPVTLESVIENSSTSSTAAAEMKVRNNTGVQAKGGVTSSNFVSGNQNVAYFVGFGSSLQKVIYGSQGSGSAESEFWVDDVERMTLTASGLTVNGSMVLTSDERLKENINSIPSALSSLKRIRGVRYNWRDKSISADAQMGVLAQEVEAVFPELVQTNDEGLKGVNYSGLIAPLIEAVKEQQQIIEKLEKRIYLLEKESTGDRK